MTNKEFRSDLAKEMWDKYNERNEKLGQVEKSSFSDWLKGQMRKEIMENFNKEIDEMKSRPWYEEARRTHLEEIKTKIKLAKSKKEYEDSLKAYEDAQIAHRWEIEDDWNILEIPQELKDYRQAWEEKIGDISDKIKGRIIKAAEKIKVNVKTESDGSRLIEFKLWWKKWKILDPKLKTHSDKKYWVDPNYNSIKHIDDAVLLKWMRWFDVDDWDNKGLARYVKEKEKGWLYVPTKHEMWELLWELGKQINSDELSDQIAMLMYFTGMDWTYRLSMIGRDSRFILGCYQNWRDIGSNSGVNISSSLCMIGRE